MTLNNDKSSKPVLVSVTVHGKHRKYRQADVNRKSITKSNFHSLHFQQLRVQQNGVTGGGNHQKNGYIYGKYSYPREIGCKTTPSECMGKKKAVCRDDHRTNQCWPNPWNKIQMKRIIAVKDNRDHDLMLVCSLCNAQDNEEKCEEFLPTTATHWATEAKTKISWGTLWLGTCITEVADHSEAFEVRTVCRRQKQ